MTALLFWSAFLISFVGLFSRPRARTCILALWLYEYMMLEPVCHLFLAEE